MKPTNLDKRLSNALDKIKQELKCTNSELLNLKVKLNISKSVSLIEQKSCLTCPTNDFYIPIRSYIIIIYPENV